MSNTPTSSPGWYPDPHLPDTQRYWDGNQWTEHVAPVGSPAGGPPMAPTGGSRAWIWWVVGAAVLVLILVVGLVVVVVLASDPLADAADTTCSELAEQAVDISEEQGGQFLLLKVREPEIVEDNRETFEVPDGTEENLILECEGLGVWSRGPDSTVSLLLTVDSDGEVFVAYEGTE